MDRSGSVEFTVRKLAAKVGAPQGPDEWDGADRVSVEAGWVTHWFAKKADRREDLAQVHRDLIADIEVGQEDACEQRFAGELAKVCAEIAALHPDAPGDAIRDAFAWTGWCHAGHHSSGTRFCARLVGPGVPDEDQREAIEAAYARALLGELITPAAVDQARKAGRRGGGTYWARRWQAARARAMADVFPDGLPPRIRMRLEFSNWPRWRTSFGVGAVSPVRETCAMSTDFLRSLAQQQLPVRFEDQHSIQCAHVLRAAHLVEAEIVYAVDPNTYLYAVVQRITHEGEAAIQRMDGDKPLA